MIRRLIPKGYEPRKLRFRSERILIFHDNADDLSRRSNIVDHVNPNVILAPEIRIGSHSDISVSGHCSRITPSIFRNKGNRGQSIDFADTANGSPPSIKIIRRIDIQITVAVTDIQPSFTVVFILQGFQYRTFGIGKFRAPPDPSLSSEQPAAHVRTAAATSNRPNLKRSFIKSCFSSPAVPSEPFIQKESVELKSYLDEQALVNLQD